MSLRAARRSFVLAAAAAVVALSIPVGNPVAAPVRAAGPVYPQVTDTTNFEGPSSIDVSANAGVIDLTSDATAPTPASVIGQAGPGPIQSAAILRADLTKSPLASTSLVSLHLEKLPIDIPLSTIPITRATSPKSWQELLAGTILQGVPLVAVTWKDVSTLAPAGLSQLSMADVDWTNSALADLPLAALTFGGADITTVLIPLQQGEPDNADNDSAAERWCYLLNQLKANTCAKPDDLTGQTLIGISIEGAPLKNIPLKNIPLKNIDLATSPLKNIPLKNIVLNVAPLKNIPLKNIDLQSSPLKNIPLKNIDLATSPLKNIPLKNIAWATSPLKNIPLKNINLATSALGLVPLKNIDFAFAPLKNIPLKNITVATSPLKNIPLKNIDFTTAPLKNIPLKNIDFSSLAAAPLKNIPLKNIATAGAPLKNIPLKNIAWATAPLKNIPLKNIDLALAGVGSVPLTALNWNAIPLGSRLATDFNTGGAPFASVPAGGATLAQVAAANGFTAGATLNTLEGALTSATDITLGDLRLDIALPSLPAITLEQLLTALSAASNPTLGDLLPGSVVSTPTLGDLRLDLLADTGITVANLLAILTAAQPDVLLGDLRIDLIAPALAPALTLADFIASLSATTATGVTLGDLRLDLATGIDALVLNDLSAFLLDPLTFAAFLLGDLTTYTDVTGHDITLGELGTWTLDPGGDITLGQLAQYLDDSVTLADVLLGLVPAADFPFENFPISSLSLDDPGRSIFHAPAPGGDASVILSPQTTLSVVVFVKSGADATDPALLHITAPAGTKFTGLLNNVVSNPVYSTDPDGRSRVTANLASLAPNSLPGITVEWVPGINLGPQVLTFGISAPDGTPVGTDLTQQFRDLVDGAEPNSSEDGSFNLRRMPHLDGNPLSNPMVDSLVSGYISTSDDVDWYQLDNVPAGSRISADLTNLPVDADLVLYGPPGLDISPTLFPSSQQGLPGALVEDPDLGVGTVAKQLAVQALSDLRLDRGWLDLTAPRTPENDFSPPLIKMTPLSISQHRGTDAESVGYIAPVTGNYVVAVSGYNGSTSNNPYLLRVRATNPPAATTCLARTFPSAFGDIATTPTAPSGSTALILTAPNRIHATYGDAGTTAIATAIGDLTAYLAAHTGAHITPGVVDLYSYPAVKTAYDAWDAHPCSVDSVNEVVRQITKVINGLRVGNPDLAYITIVGGDDIIPMGRVVDLTRTSNEAEYAETFGDDHNPISAAEAGGYTLTDDPYGDTSPTDIGNGSSLFIPRLAVGRLVESPTEIAAQLESFGAHGGVLDTHTGLVAGYDFLADGAQAVADRLAAPGRTIDTSLIDTPGTTAPWNGADLLGKLFPAGGATPLIDSINAHYDHSALQPSDPAADIVTAQQLVGAGAVADSPNRLAGRLLFTMGCHAGLAVPDSYLSAADAALGVDWAQTLSAAGVSVYVANTGFGIGDTASVAYTEKLMALYAKLLDGSLTAGQAMAYAKQAYYGSLGAVGVYDTKILEQTEFYGLPFWGISVTSGNGQYGSAGSTSAQVIPPALTVPTTVDSTTHLATLDTSVASSFKKVDVANRGSYWVVTHPDGDETPFTAQDRPIQPQTVLGVGGGTLVPHGVMVTSLTQLADKPNINPVLASLSADQATATAEVHADQASWPARMAVVNSFTSPTGNQADLVLVPGQFLGATDGSGSQRLFDNVGVRVFYADASHDNDFLAPDVKHGRGIGHGNQIDFTVSASDPAGATTAIPAGVTAVRVGFRDFDGTWKFQDLASSGGDWTGTFTGLSRTFASTDVVPWFAQAVDGAGNVGTGSGKALGFVATGPDSTPPSLTFTITPAPDASGIVAANLATVTFHCSDTESGIEPGDCPDPEMVTAQGKTEVHAHVLDRAGNEVIAVATVILDTTRPTITATVSPPDWANAPSGTVTFTCKAGSAPLVGTCPAPVTVTTTGDTPVTRSITDMVGRTASVTAHVRLDPTPPIITAKVTPAPNAAGWNHDTTDTVTFTCSDALSGIADGACPDPVEITSDGVYQISRTVFDLAGNGATVNLSVFSDSTKPTISGVIAPPPNAAGWNRDASVSVSFTCADNLSGLAGSCPAPTVITTDGVFHVTGTIGDVAGNSSTQTLTVRRDVTPPTITAAVTPAPNGAGWNRTAPVTVTFTCSDATSGIPDGGCPAPVVISAEGIQTVSRSVQDVAGNSAPASVTVKLDMTNPVVTFDGDPGTVKTCGTADALSGVATPATGTNVTVRVAGIPTTTLTCSGATDVAGNATPTSSITYVAPITFSGFLDPVNNAPTVNTGTAGRTYPVKFTLTGIDGLPITVLPAVKSELYVLSTSCTGAGDTLEAQTSGNSQLTFDATTNTFQYNWKTPSQKGCYEFRLGIADLTTKTSLFSLK